MAAVVREGSFEHAVRALHVMPSVASQHIRGNTSGCLVVRGQRCQATDTVRRQSQ